VKLSPAARDGAARSSLGPSIKLACQAFGASFTYYRYQPQLSSQNAEIADHLISLKHNQRNWGFGLCFLYLRNVKGYRWGITDLSRAEPAHQAAQTYRAG